MSWQVKSSWHERAATKEVHSASTHRCLNCGCTLKRTPKWRRPKVESHKMYGAYGDGAFCGLACGHIYACRALLAVPDLEQLVPTTQVDPETGEVRRLAFPLGERVR